MYWTPPGEQRQLIGPDVFSTTGGAWEPGTVTEPPGYELPPEKAVGTSKISPNATIGTGANLQNPGGIAVDQQGNVYIGDRGNHRIVVFSPDGKVVRTWGSAPPADGKAPQQGQFSNIGDLAFAEDGTLFVLDSNRPLVQGFSTGGQVKRVVDLSKAAPYSPNGLFVAPDGMMYVADTGLSRVLRLAPSSDGVPFAAFTGLEGKNNSSTYTKFEQPLDIVTSPKDPTGGFYMIDLKNRVLHVLPDGDVDKQWPLLTGGSDGGSRMAISANGSRIYVTDTDHGQIGVLNISTGTVKYIGDAGQLLKPTGIALGPDEKIYVVDSTQNVVQVFSADGQ